MKNIDLVKKICSLTGHEPKIEFVKDRLGHDHRYSVSSEKISSVGVVTTADIDKELKETVSDVFNSILEDDDDELKDTLNDVFNSVRK